MAKSRWSVSPKRSRTACVERVSRARWRLCGRSGRFRGIRRPERRGGSSRWSRRHPARQFGHDDAHALLDRLASGVDDEPGTVPRAVVPIDAHKKNRGGDCRPDRRRRRRPAARNIAGLRSMIGTRRRTPPGVRGVSLPRSHHEQTRVDARRRGPFSWLRVQGHRPSEASVSRLRGRRSMASASPHAFAVPVGWRWRRGATERRSTRSEPARRSGLVSRLRLRDETRAPRRSAHRRDGRTRGGVPQRGPPRVPAGRVEA